MQNEGVAVYTAPSSASPPADRSPQVAVPPTKGWHWIALGVIAVVAAFLNFFQLQLNGYGNTYYAAAVRSMLESWHNFFFVSFDPGGFVTVDKPPLGLWIQAASARIFGFSGTSLLLPQAVAGVLSVIVLYHIVRRTFGPIAGLLAALALALSPISVVMNRDNNLDTLLVLTVLLAAWTVLIATETGRLRWLLLTTLIVGLGFNIKTLEAYLVVPAFGLVYLLGSPHGWWKRVWHLALAALVLLVISFSWIAIVDLTPASQRPYVGSSQTNSELELALGYNGLERLTGLGQSGFGGRGGAGNRPGGTNTTAQPPSFGDHQAPNGQNGQFPDFPSGGGNGAGFGGGGFGGGGNIFNEGGSPGPLRLFRVNLGSQVSWLLPLALIGMLALAWQTRRIRLPLDRRQQSLIIWGVWLLTMGTFFSVAGFYHSYYLVMIAPAICALAAIGLVILWHDYRERSFSDWRSWMLPVALLLTAAEQAFLLSYYDGWDTWMTPLIVGLCLVSAVALIIARLPLAIHLRPQRWQRSAVNVGMLALLIAPFVWSVVSINQAGNSTLPTAGPITSSSDLVRSFAAENSEFAQAIEEYIGAFNRGSSNAGGRVGAGGFGSGSVSVDSALVNYLEAHQGNARFLLATTNSMSAAPIIIETGKAVMALGGFSGSDPILTTNQLAALVKNGTVRFFQLNSFGGIGTSTSASASNTQDTPAQTQPGEQTGRSGFFGGGGFGGGGSQSSITSWVTSHCTTVPTSAYSQSSSSSSNGQGDFGGGGQLYDCAGAK